MKLFKSALVFLAFLASTAHAASFTLDAGGGNGTVAGSYPGFTLTGADYDESNGSHNYLTTYTGLFDSNQWVSFVYSYTTNDVDGSSYDPAGYILNGSLYQLTPNNLPEGGYVIGNKSVNVHAGDTFGWYILSTDSVLGTATFTVIATVSAVPEPETYAMLLLGLGAIGFAARRQQPKA